MGSFTPTIKFIDNANNAFGVRQADNKMLVSTVPHTYDIAKGNLPNHGFIRKFGANADVGITEEVMWTVGGAYTYLTTAQTIEIDSTSSSDTLFGTGARTVSLQGLDANFEPLTETISLAGHAGVTTTGLFTRVFRLKVLTAGSSSYNVGDISVKGSSDKVVIGEISARNNQTQMALWTVAADTTFYLVGVWASEVNSDKARIRIYTREFGSNVFQIKLEINVKDNYVYRPFPFPLEIAGKTDIEMRAVSLTANAVMTGGFDGWYDED
jgi:hypothetical protein